MVRLKGVERTPILGEDGVALGRKTRGDIRRLAARLAPEAPAFEARWRRRLPVLLGGVPEPAVDKALTALNPGAWATELAAGRLEECLETVAYHGRRLAKLDAPPRGVLASVSAYAALVRPALRRWFPGRQETYSHALDHLYFAIESTLSAAYYRVRDAEAAAFFDVLEDELETLRARDLLKRVLGTLARTFRADGGAILLLDAETGRLTAKAWQGLTPALARGFDAALGEGFAGEIAATGRAAAIVDTGADERVRSARLRRAFRSIWGVPLLVHGAVTGVATLGFAREYHCLPRERKLFEAVAERCALAIEKAQLVEELRLREERIRALGEHLMRVEEEERRRISRELHDEVGQALLVARLYLEMAEGMTDGERAALRNKLRETREVLENTIVEMRRLISALSPNVLQELGLTAGIRQFVKNLSRTWPGRVRLRMTDVDGLPDGPKVMMYRLVQECFTNAVKHSGAANASLVLARRNGSVLMRMEDDGKGFDPGQAAGKRESFGIAGMRERVELLGGRIEIASAPGKGTKVSIAIPV